MKNTISEIFLRKNPIAKALLCELQNRRKRNLYFSMYAHKHQMIERMVDGWLGYEGIILFTHTLTPSSSRSGRAQRTRAALCIFIQQDQSPLYIYNWRLPRKNTSLKVPSGCLFSLLSTFAALYFRYYVIQWKPYSCKYFSLNVHDTMTLYQSCRSVNIWTIYKLYLL